MTDTKRSRGLVVAVVVLVLLLGLSLLTLLLTRDDEGGQAAPSATTSAPPTTPSSRSDEVPAPLSAAPAGVTWELFQGVALPTSRTDGPSLIDGPVHSGFSRTPTGALLADVQISSRVLVDRDVQNLRQVAQVQLVEGPGKTAHLNVLSRLTVNDPPSTGYAQIVGFRYITYTPELAVISRATRDQNGRMQVATDSVRWVNGDWKLEKPASGLQQPQVVQDLSGYVPWAGVS